MWRRVISTRNRRATLLPNAGDEQYPPRTCAVFPGDEWFPPRTRALFPRSPKTWRACHEELLPRRFTHQLDMAEPAKMNSRVPCLNSCCVLSHDTWDWTGIQSIWMSSQPETAKKVVARERGRISHRRRSPLPTCHRQR
jgi:hypothetical protein